MLYIKFCNYIILGTLCNTYIFQGRRLAAEEWSGDNAKNFFEKLYRLGMCELMHTAPLLGRSQLGDSNTEGLKSTEIKYKTIGTLYIK